MVRRILLAGDAVGHVAPLIGEDIKFALIAGHLAAESIILYLRNHISLYELGRIYLSKLKKSFYKRFKLEKILLKMFVKRKISSAKMLNDSIMRRAIAELYTDRRELHKLVLASLLRVPAILFR